MKKQFLDNSGMLELVSLLKKYIHDNKVRPFTNKSLFPKTGKEDLIYIDNSNDLLYRWDAGAGAYKPLSPLKVSELVNDSGFLSSVPTATNTVTGGILADTKTSTDTVPVKIGSDKKLYTTPTLSDAGKVHIQNGDIHTTVADKQKATTAYNHSQTAHAPSNAERNIIVSVQKNGTDLNVDTSTRKVNITVPTKVSELINDSGFKTTDNNTTYTLTKSGNTITLTGSDGSKTAVVDENTIYTALKNPHAITISINGASQGVYDGSSAKAVDITNTKLGLGNVENKSSATIRSEITKANVTTALGYTPMTPNEINNKFATLETNIDWKESVATYADIAKTYPNPVDGWTVNVNDTDYTYRYNGTSWIAISANAIPKATNTVDGILSKEDHINFADANAKKHTHSNKSVIDGITANNISTWNTVTNKVDKISGKNLSTNDYTTAEKNKLAGIATGAEVNQNAYSNIKVGSTTISADTKTDTLEIVAGSNVTITPDATSDKLTIAAKDTIYTHPSATAYTSGLYKITTNNLGHVTAATAVTKADITALGIPGQDTNTTYGLASSTANGLIKIGYSANGRNYPVALDSTGKAYVTVPWTDTNTTYNLTSFGITATAAEINQLKGATSGIQAQLNNKASLSHTHGYLPLTGGSISGSVTFTEDASGLKWSRVSDGASILFHAESDGSNNALTFNISDNGDEYFKWTQTSSTATETLGTWKTEGIRLSKGNFIGNLIGNASTATALTTNAGSATQPVYFSGGKPVTCTYTLGKSVPSNAVFTDTVYTHPSTSGNKHIPSGGSAGQILRWSADGTAVWGADNNTVYSAFKGANGSAAGSQGLVPSPAAADNIKYLRGDGVWATPPNTTYGVVTGSANGLMTPALFNKLNGIAAGANNYTHPSSHAATMVTQDSTHRFVTDSEKSTWNSKANGNHSHSWGSVTGKPDIFNCMRMYGGTALDSKGTTADSAAQYNTIALSTATVNTVAFNKVLTDLPKGKYSVMIRMKISANTNNGNILKLECGDTSALKTVYVRPNMFNAANKYQTFGFTVDVTSNSFTAKLSVGTALASVTANIDYIAIAPTFTAITSIA